MLLVVFGSWSTKLINNSCFTARRTEPFFPKIKRNPSSLNYKKACSKTFTSYLKIILKSAGNKFLL